MKPLEGIVVVDVTAALAGPYATFLLGALGARVVKVENPRGGDRVRNHPPFAGADGVTLRRAGESDLSVPFLSRGRGKESVTLDLKHPEGPGVLLDLVRSADVVVENFSRGTADRLGIGYAACRVIATPPAPANGGWLRTWSPRSGRSTLTTRAPSAPSRKVAYGPARACVTSTTVIPSSGFTGRAPRGSATPAP